MNEFVLGVTHNKRFTSRQFSTGTPFTLAGTPVVSAYENDSATQITAGITLGVDHDTVTGLNLLTLALTAANGYEYGKDYDLVVTAGTVDGVSVVGEVLSSFRMMTKSEIACKFHQGNLGPGVYIDLSNGNTNSQVGVDGTPSNPVGNFSVAKTIADELGIRIFYISDPTGPSFENLPVAMAHYTFYCLTGKDSVTLDFNGQSVGDSRFINLSVQGPMGAGNRAILEDCIIKEDFLAAVTTLHAVCYNCGFEDEVTFDTSADNAMVNCYSLVDSTAGVAVKASGAAGSLNVYNFSGKVVFHDLSASHNLFVEGNGEITFDVSCDVNANVDLVGIFNLADDTAGMASLSENGVINIPKINAECDQALVDITAATLNRIADHVVRRNSANARASLDGDAVNFRSLLGAASKLHNKVGVDGTGANLLMRTEDDVTIFGTQAITASAGADPITELDTV
jgi:hypothetical protein